jgi:diacylglycerol O-acyltransferase
MPSSYERMSALDRFFIDVETPNTHMHVAAAMLFDSAPLIGEGGGVDIDRIRSYIASRLHLIPRYRQKIMHAPLTGQPVWVDDDRLNMHYHVRHTALPRPGDIDQLTRLAARIVSQKLERGKPLWEIWIVEGLADGRCAMISKTHHCMVDGISGVDLMTVLLDIAPKTGIHDVPGWTPRPPPHPLQLVGDEITRRLTQPLELVRAGREALADFSGACQSLGSAVAGLRDVLGAGFVSASETPLNHNVGGHRRFEWLTLDLDSIKDVKRALGGTVNDIVLATVAGAVSRFLGLRGIPVRRQCDLDFRAFCPVSVRDASERGTLGNRVSGMIIPLPIGEVDPVRRIERVRETTANAKASHQALGAEVLATVSEWTLPTLLTVASRLSIRSRAYNMVVTNVPGPQLPLYLLGAQLVEAFPLVPLFENQALGVALFSYDGKLCWGFNADWDLLPDLTDLVESVSLAFRELQDAARAVTQETVTARRFADAMEASIPSDSLDGATK